MCNILLLFIISLSVVIMYYHLCYLLLTGMRTTCLGGTTGLTISSLPISYRYIQICLTIIVLTCIYTYNCTTFRFLVIFMFMPMCYVIVVLYLAVLLLLVIVTYAVSLMLLTISYCYELLLLLFK